MAAPDRRSYGGGANFQCLPSEPEYEQAPGLPAVYSDLLNVFYGAPPMQYHLVPCAVCETRKRVTKLMIPARIQCPSDDWVLEYVGYLYTSHTQYDSHRFVSPGDQHRTTYECVDRNMESLNNQTVTVPFRSVIHRVKARCGGEGALVKGCPPYRANQALSCVVCSK